VNSWRAAVARSGDLIAVLAAAIGCLLVSMLMESLAAQLVWSAAGVLLLLFSSRVKPKTEQEFEAEVTKRRAAAADDEFTRLAIKALSAAVHDRPGDAAETVEGIATVHGSVGVQAAMITWCDLFLDHAKGGLTPAQVNLQITFQNDDGDDSGAETPPELLWAQRMIYARANASRQQWAAALNDLPTDDAPRVGAHVMTLLNLVALTMRDLPRGYAWQDPNGGGNN
jgi:hypothetical protein